MSTIWNRLLVNTSCINKSWRLQTEPDRELFLAVTNKVANTIFSVEIGQILLDGNIVKVLVFDPESEIITQWLPN
ncbi:element excision factor XisH family protein [Thiothrix unzii]|uniref:element excision factor XisH family protein n=1 Tax=Thiothrix unzii TaxID=111769 RepID=UPI003CCED64F